jgi:hypothetical protein
MALADPQSVTINSVAVSLPRTGQTISSGEFTSNDGLVSEVVSHQKGKRNRHMIRINHRKVGADPFQASVNAEYSMSAYVVFDVPTVGYTVAEQKQVVDGFIAQLNASSGALITKVLGNEN